MHKKCEYNNTYPSTSTDITRSLSTKQKSPYIYTIYMVFGFLLSACFARPRMFKCSNVQMLRCSDVQMIENIRMFESSNVPMLLKSTAMATTITTTRIMWTNKVSTRNSRNEFLRKRKYVINFFTLSLPLFPSLSCALLGTDPLWQVARLGYFKVNLSTGGIKKVASTCFAGAVISAHLKQPLSENISKHLKMSEKKTGKIPRRMI